MSERFYISVVSGERRGVLAALLRALLFVLSAVYRVVLAVRAAAYTIGVRRRHRVPCKVISVGNITVGGTGKTPMVEYLARYVASKGKRVAIVSRGYAALAGRNGANDEALVLRENLRGVPQIQDPDRVRASLEAVRRHGADCVILDDAFQHWRLARDLDIVLVDATNPFGYGGLLPRGLLREPPSALARAHCLVLSRANLCPPDRLREVRDRLERLRAEGTTLVEMGEEPICLTRLDGPERYPVEWLHGRAVYAFCGIGNPRAFVRLLERLGATVKGKREFDDHHAYGPGDLADLGLAAHRSGAEAIVTTQKDAVKIANAHLGTRCFVLNIRVALAEGRERLERLVDEVLEARK